MPKRPDIIEYNDLNGEEALEILHTRFYDLLHDLPELQQRFTLTRVKLRLEIALEVSGGTPPKRIYHDSVEIKVANPLIEGIPEKTIERTLVAEVDTFNNPPDEARVDHGLPVPRAIRSQAGMMETGKVVIGEPKYPPPPPVTPVHLLPANQASPNQMKIGRRTYAAFIEQDYGSVMAKERTGGEGPVIGGEKIQSVGGGGGGEHAPVQPDFRVADYRQNLSDEAKTAAISDALAKGRKVDEVLSSQPVYIPDPSDESGEI